MRMLANSEDLDEMLQEKKQSSENEMQVYLEIITCDNGPSQDSLLYQTGRKEKSNLYIKGYSNRGNH